MAGVRYIADLDGSSTPPAAKAEEPIIRHPILYDCSPSFLSKNSIHLTLYLNEKVGSVGIVGVTKVSQRN